MPNFPTLCYFSIAANGDQDDDDDEDDEDEDDEAGDMEEMLNMLEKDVGYPRRCKFNRLYFYYCVHVCMF